MQQPPILSFHTPTHPIVHRVCGLAQRRADSGESGFVCGLGAPA